MKIKVLCLFLITMGCNPSYNELHVDDTLYVTKNDFSDEQLSLLMMGIDAWALATNGCVELNMSFNRAPDGEVTIDGKARLHEGEVGRTFGIKGSHLQISFDLQKVKHLDTVFAHELGHAFGMHAHTLHGLMCPNENCQNTDIKRNDDGIIIIDDETLQAFFYLKGDECKERNVKATTSTMP